MQFVGQNKEVTYTFVGQNKEVKYKFFNNIHHSKTSLVAQWQRAV
jgi:hypothetical protein